ncbi:hypothetical protein [Streptomyces sp. NBC_01281]|uniref:hypothetical protein n=1 Tax=Streptomyces sp. NBC_01281 TaxID=2903811 RepID=UPI003DA63D6A
MTRKEWARLGGMAAFVVALHVIIIGYVVVGLFFATWIVALLVWKLGRIEEKWTEGLAQPAEQRVE